MTKAATWILSALLLTVLVATPALAGQYPPTCSDSISIWNLQNPAALCHPVSGDTVWVGIGGVVTGRDTKTSGVGFYMQLSGGGPYSGINVFTANTIWPVAVGDSVIVRPSMVNEYNGETQMVSLTGSWGDNLYVYKVLGPTALPPFYEGNTTDFNNLTTNTALEPYECGLAKVLPRGGPLRVARVYSTSFMVVDSACTSGICDSVFVDVSTLPNPTMGVPPLNTTLSWIQGIVGQTAAGYRIRMRDDNDWYPSVNPPVVADAYAIKDDSVRVVFDKQVTQASAENAGNYSLATFGAIVNSATLEPNGSCVMLNITNGLGHGVQETVNVSGVVAVVNGKAMVGIMSRTFWNGLTPIADIQAPDPAGLLADPCLDRSLFAGVGSAAGTEKVTYRGVCTAAFPGGLYYVQDASGPTRAGLATYAPITPLVVGHQYLLVANIQEYYEETEAVYNVYVRDEGVATPPTPVVQTAAVLRDATCDASQSITNGEDYEGMLVRMNWVMSLADSTLLPGYGFDVADPPYSAYTDSIHIRNVQSSAGWTYAAVPDMLLDVTGILTYSFATMQVAPRFDSDFVDHGALDVPPGTLSKVSFSAYPNPARVTKVSFALPKQSVVDLSVYDLSGRKVASLASGSMPAGQYTRDWDGGGAGAGVYFVRLRVDSETYNIRTVSLK